MTYTEDVIQNAICKYLDMRKVCYWAVPNGGSRKGGAIEGARLKKTGVKSGVPDITVVYDGMYWGLEVKRPATDKHPKGYLTQSQKDMHEKIRNAGGSVETVYSVADVILWLNTEVMYERKFEVEK
jgi:hypothetical protein